MISKNTICRWFDGTALEAPEVCAATLPASAAIKAARQQGPLRRHL